MIITVLRLPWGPPPLAPADLAHVPRWLDELGWAEAKAAHCLAHPTSPLAGRPAVRVDYPTPRELPKYPQCDGCATVCPFESWSDARAAGWWSGTWGHAGSSCVLCPDCNREARDDGPDWPRST